MNSWTTYINCQQPCYYKQYSYLKFCNHFLISNHLLLLGRGQKNPMHDLQFIFNLFLESGVFPIRWETSFIKPIHKSGSKSCVENYRGTVILPTLGKHFELLVCRELPYEYKNYLSSCQHGFVSGRSLSTNQPCLFR